MAQKPNKPRVSKKGSGKVKELMKVNSVSQGQASITLNHAALVSSGKSKPDGNDLFFADISGKLLNSRIESGLNTARCSVSVYFDSLPGGALFLHSRNLTKNLLKYRAELDRISEDLKHARGSRPMQLSTYQAFIANCFIWLFVLAICYWLKNAILFVPMIFAVSMMEMVLALYVFFSETDKFEDKLNYLTWELREKEEKLEEAAAKESLASLRLPRQPGQEAQEGSEGRKGAPKQPKKVKQLKKGGTRKGR